jgi:hypothetical protein
VLIKIVLDFRAAFALFAKAFAFFAVPFLGNMAVNRKVRKELAKRRKEELEIN